METYKDLVELARICIRQAKMASNKTVADELLRMATEYEEPAAKLVRNGLPRIDEHRGI